MKNKLLAIIDAISFRNFIFILLLSFTVFHSLVFSGSRQAVSIITPYFNSAVSIFFCIILLFILLIAVSLCFKKEASVSLTYAGIVLSPIFLLYAWNPGGYYISFFMPFALILLTQVCFFLIISGHNQIMKMSGQKEKLLILALAVLYFIIFSYIAIRKFNTFSLFNPKDFANHNQTFWNTIHGRFFINSLYGSNFACHNSLFFILLAPFYYFLPHPLTLSVLKILLFSCSVIPFYLIAKDIIKEMPVIPIMLTLLFYPYLVAQNLTAPHEITYAPFFILFTYYFFRKSKFLYFFIFLILTLSIKEHLALSAIMFGLFSVFLKRSGRWVFVPIVLGVFWFSLSLWVIFSFQKIFHPNPDAVWFLTNLKIRSLWPNTNLFSSLSSIISSSNIFSWYKFRNVIPLFSSLGTIPPLLGPVSILGLPEFLINILSDRPVVLTVPWHYNIVVSCFLLIGTLEGIKKISHLKWIVNHGIKTNVAMRLICVFILSFTLMHSYLWLWLTKYTKGQIYIKIRNEALSLIPEDASVSVTRNMAVHVSNRREYSLINEHRREDYILLDRTVDVFPSGQDINNRYIQIFNKGNVIVFKKAR